MIWQAIESGATALGVFVVGWQIWRTKKQKVTAFEDVCHANTGKFLRQSRSTHYSGKSFLQRNSKRRENGIYHYLDLSNEQVFLRQNKRVSSETWKIWCDGIKANLSRKAFEEVWKRIKEAIPDNFLELQKLEADFTADPRKWKDLNKPKNPHSPSTQL
jgi:hypothetical protein